MNKLDYTSRFVRVISTLSPNHLSHNSIGHGGRYKMVITASTSQQIGNWFGCKQIMSCKCEWIQTESKLCYVMESVVFLSFLSFDVNWAKKWRKRKTRNDVFFIKLVSRVCFCRCLYIDVRVSWTLSRYVAQCGSLASFFHRLFLVISAFVLSLLFVVCFLVLVSLFLGFVVSWLHGLLVSWLLGLLFACLLGCVIAWSVGRSVGWWAGGLVVCWSVGCLVVGCLLVCLWFVVWSCVFLCVLVRSGSGCCWMVILF